MRASTEIIPAGPSAPLPAASHAWQAPSMAAGHEPARVRVGGKFLFLGRDKFYVRGITYGPFRPEAGGCEYHDPQTVERDFQLMAANRINTVRTYTVPPAWLLDLAQQNGLRVMVGLPWEQHITFLDEWDRADNLERRIRASVRALNRHPALLAYTIGNEIPAPSGKEAVSRTYGVAYRTDVIDVRVRCNGGEVEYMIKMNAGDALVYSWEVPGVTDPQAFLTEFHGHRAGRRARRLDVLRERPRPEGERLARRALAGHSRLVLEEQWRCAGGCATADGRLL